ncbi:hypothetical protein D9M71_487210 [compost metagenome]
MARPTGSQVMNHSARGVPDKLAASNCMATDENTNSPSTPLPMRVSRLRQAASKTASHTNSHSPRPGKPSSIAMWVSMLCEWSKSKPLAVTPYGAPRPRPPQGCSAIICKLA